MATNERLGPAVEVAVDAAESADLSEEQASQGHKTGHMRWVLGIGFVLACLVLAGAAVLHA
jgi:hypothetical protein